MFSPFSLLYLFIFLFLISFLFIFIQLGLISAAFTKLGLTPLQGMALFLFSLFGSAINIPLFSIRAEAPNGVDKPTPLPGLLRQFNHRFKGRTQIAVNIGGCLIPLSFSIHLLQLHGFSISEIILPVALMSWICYAFSQPIPGIGIGMPIFVAPIAAAAIAVLFDPGRSAPLAYICGTLGVIIGADLLHLKDLRHLGAPMASIGGAGTFDGIFLTGVVAVLLS